MVLPESARLLKSSLEFVISYKEIGFNRAVEEVKKIAETVKIDPGFKTRSRRKHAVCGEGSFRNNFLFP